MQLESNHISLTSATDIEEIITPLKKYGIIFFMYVRSYTDGSRIRLSTHPHHLKAWYENKWYRDGNIDAHPKLYADQFALHSTLPNQNPIQWVQEHFAIAHGIYLIRPNDGFTEFFNFASTPENHNIINFYLNNIDFLKKFSDFFKDKAQAIIKQSEQYKIITPFHDIAIKPCQSVDLTQIELAAKKIKITSRQSECINLLLKGATAKEIAKRLKLSNRTIESYIDNLKTKFHAHNKTDLIIRLLDANF
jgi:DNA-binding CsgD family transcriptional regulator